VKNIRCKELHSLRLVDLYFKIGDESAYNQASALFIDSFRFLESLNELRKAPLDVPQYFAVQCYSDRDSSSNSDTPELHFEILDSRHERDPIRINQDDVNSLGLINIAFGHIVSAELFHQLKPYLDHDMFTVGHWKNGEYRRWGGEMGNKVVWPDMPGRLGMSLLTRLKWRFFPED